MTRGDNPMAWIGNRTSFWHTEASMARLFGKAGYSQAIVIDPILASGNGARRINVLKP
ncbi:MAG: hypothetical protein IT555_11935 [Acetobacteraceae bacterium]|nr:hypothetical protein [Acetobacteraceae bacterium]